MRKYVIVSDSCCDLDKAMREKYEVDYIPMRILYEDKDIPASLDWEEISFKDFYRMMREGVKFKTSQVNAKEYTEAFEKYLADGYDILSISCSSALSGSYKESLIAAEKLKGKHPDAKIVCVDSRNSSLGLGMICMIASQLRAEGRSIEETASYLESNKQKVNQFCTVESLTYLKRAGRVSVASAVFGGLLQVKPILISDVSGQNVAIEKVKGRKASMIRIADLFKETYEHNPLAKICIVHADCEEDAGALKQLVLERLPDRDVEVVEGHIGPIIGASAGPGTIAVYTYGKAVTYGGEE